MHITEVLAGDVYKWCTLEYHIVSVSGNQATYHTGNPTFPNITDCAAFILCNWDSVTHKLKPKNKSCR